jgi:hypothetical protein
MILPNEAHFSPKPPLCSFTTSMWTEELVAISLMSSLNVTIQVPLSTKRGLATLGRA